MKKKVALLFWGLTRGLKYTIYSINENVILPLKKANYDVDVFLHTYYFNGLYNNDRHGVRNFKLDFNEYKLLNPKDFIIENQDEVKKHLDLKKYRQKPDHFKNNYQSNDFYILSLHSQRKVTNLFKKYSDQYEYCIFLRPDVIFVSPIDVSWLSLVGDNTMILPSWATYKKHKEYSENDRFCICKPIDSYKYGNIFSFILIYSQLESIVAEAFLGFILNLYYKVNIIRVKFLFKRVLPNGQLMFKDA